MCLRTCKGREERRTGKEDAWEMEGRFDFSDLDLGIQRHRLGVGGLLQLRVVLLVLCNRHCSAMHMHMQEVTISITNELSS